MSGPSSSGGRKELYFLNGRLHHVASSNATELLGEYLVRRGTIDRDELEVALTVLPRHGGRMGDTLIALGLVDPVEIFRAIREQGRDRVADLFRWPQGRVTFYRGQTAPNVEFPLDLDLPALVIAGLEAAHPREVLEERFRDRLEAVLAKGPSDRRGLVEGIRWPPVVVGVMGQITRGPLTLRELLARTTTGEEDRASVLRIVELLLAARLAKWA